MSRKVRKTTEQRIEALEEEIMKSELRIEEEREKLAGRKKRLQELQAESTMEVVKSYNLSPSELKALLDKHVPGNSFSPGSHIETH